MLALSVLSWRWDVRRIGAAIVPPLALPPLLLAAGDLREGAAAIVVRAALASAAAFSRLRLRLPPIHASCGARQCFDRGHTSELYI